MGWINNSILKILFIILAIAVSGFEARSDTAKDNKGTFSGPDYSFSFSLPESWIIDDQNGYKLESTKVFYPSAGKSFAESPVILYGKSVSKSDITTIKLQTEITIQKHKNNGNYNYKIEKYSLLNIADEKTADIYYFSEDQWGNYEAIAYIEESNTINYLVYNARTEEAFKQYLKDFHTITKTYRNIFTP